MELTKIHIKQLIDKYPYLQPRNIWTDKISEEYDYDYIRGVHEIPPGWSRLFLMYCKDIYLVLKECGYLDKFRFTQIKEKYNTLRIYDNGHIPEIESITQVYEHLSSYICQVCGNVATTMTEGWIASFCASCFNKHQKHITKSSRIKHKFKFTITEFKNNKTNKIKLNSTSVWKEYLKLRRLSDEEFITYILEC